MITAFNNPRAIKCGKPGCDYKGMDPIEVGCPLHGKALVPIVDGFILNLYCPKCMATKMRLRLVDPGHNNPVYQEEA